MNTEMNNNRDHRHSGIEWLDRIPKRWKVRRLKFISKVQSSSVDKKSKEDEDEVLLCNYVDVYKNEFIDDFIEFMKSTAPQRHIEQFTLNEGDIIITKDSEDRFDIAVPAKVNKDFDNVLCGYHLALIRADYEHINPDFLFRWFQSDLVNDQFKVAANGITRYGLSVSSIKDSIVAVPPLPEQKAIATFLDHQTSRIDQLIEKKKRILELLDEQRQAIITRAVTKGINPDVPMKNSGIEWLGNVPEHWDTVAIQYIARLKSGDTITSTMMNENADYPVYGGNGLRGYYNQYTHDGEYVLIGRQGALCGNINYAKGKFWASEHAIVVTPTVDIVTKWFGELLRTMDLNQYSVSAAQPGLSAEYLGRLKVPLPPLDEQEKISNYIELRTLKIDHLKKKIAKAIGHLEEYRSSLITQAVTGKIDVREQVKEKELNYAAEDRVSYQTN
jgi:type I restriction enzyme S subunit